MFLLERKAIDLAISAGRKRQSPRTGFVHYYGGDEGATDTIPVFENVCFAVALFRQKTAESVLEGKELLERLLAFQTEEGNFPVYLHSFPACWDFQLGRKIKPALVQILREFGSFIPSDYKEKLQRAIGKIPLEGKAFPLDDWFYRILFAQMEGKADLFPIPYDRTCQVFLGNHLAQEGGEMEPLAFEYVLAEKEGFSTRLLRDHIHQLHSALLFPFSSSEETSRSLIIQEKLSRILWKGKTLHSLVAPRGEMTDGRFVFRFLGLPEMGREDLFEAQFFVDLSPEISLRINGEKGTIFYLGDTISIQSPTCQIDLCFRLSEGEGEFCGHLCRSNRPSQKSCHGANLYAAYDTQIGLRTLRRKGACTIECLYTANPG